jgi:O-antigen/teichoic acid export membrane protein
MRADRPQSLSQSLAWFTSSYVVAIVGYLAVNAVAARALGSGLFGYFVIISTVALVVGQTSLVGVHRSGLREAARVRERTDPALPQLRDDVAVIERTTVLGFSVATGVVLFLVESGDVSSRLLLAAATAALVAASAEQQLWASYLRGFGETRLAGLMEGRSGGPAVAVTQAICLVLLSLVESQMRLASAIAALAAGYALPTIVARITVTRRWKGLPPATDSTLRRLRRVLRRDWKFVVISSTTSLNQNVEIWIGGAFLTAQDSSLYSASSRLAMQLLLAGIAVQVVFSPAVSRLWSRGEKEPLNQLLRTGATLATLGLAVGWIPMLVAPEEIMALLFGDQFRSAATILVILSLGSVINCLTGMCGTALTMSGHEGVPALVGGLTIVGRVLLGLLLVTEFGVIGLAVSAVVWSVVYNVALSMFALRRLGLNTWPTLRPRIRLLRQTEG